VELLDHVGASGDEHFIASFERRSAEVVRSKLAQLDVRAHRTVEDDDAVAEEIEVARHCLPRLPSVAGLSVPSLPWPYVMKVPWG